MPPSKRRKSSLEDRDGKGGECNSVSESQESAETKEGSGMFGETTMADSSSKRRTAKKPNGAAASAATTADNNDAAAAASSSLAATTTTKSGRVIKLSKAAQMWSADIEKRNRRLNSSAKNQANNSEPAATGSVDSQTSKKAVDKQKATDKTHKKQPRAKAQPEKAVTPSRSKRNPRAWESWVDVEMSAFFEGLMEHGKNFEAIHSVVIKRSVKHAIEPEKFKNVEQTRQNYYRLWGKIAKFVHMGHGVKRTTQELYGLINYSQVRKVYRTMNEMAQHALNELIHKGSCKVYVYCAKRKKRWQILKTPVCKALLKLNNVSGTVLQNNIKELPKKILVELMPKNQATWARVQSRAKNPRVRFYMPPNRSLSAVFDLLDKKWKGSRGRLRESLGGESTDELVLYLHHSYDVNAFSLFLQQKMSFYNKNDEITFNKYKHNILGKDPKLREAAAKKSAASSGTPTAPPEDPSKRISDNSSDDPLFAEVGSPRSGKAAIRTNLLSKLNEVSGVPVEDENAMFPDAPFSHAQISAADLEELDGEVGEEEEEELRIKVEEDEVGRDDAAEGKAGDADSVIEDDLDDTDCDKPQLLSPRSVEMEISPGKTGDNEEDREREKDDFRDLDLAKVAEGAQNGFSVETACEVTLTHLDLMLEKKSHLLLEFEWRRSASVAGQGSGSEGAERMTNMLRRLSGMAMMEYRDIVQRGKIAAGNKMSQCILCSHSLDRPPRHKGTAVDAATEIDPEMLTHPALLNSKGTIVGITPKGLLNSTKDLVPDIDGVFRVPMPIPGAMFSSRSGGPQRMSLQPSISQLIRPPECAAPQPNYLLPKKRSRKQPPVHIQRNILPKPSANQLVLVAADQGQQFVQVQPVSLQTGVTSAQPVVTSLQPVVTSLQPGLTSVQLQTTGLQLVSAPHQPITTTSESSEGATTLVSSTSLRLIQEVDAGSSVPVTVGSLPPSSNGLYDMPLIVPFTSSPEKNEERVIIHLPSTPTPTSEAKMILPSVTGILPETEKTSLSAKSVEQLVQNSVNPPSLSSFFDLSLHEPSGPSDATDKFLSTVMDSDANAHFAGVRNLPAVKTEPMDASENEGRVMRLTVQFPSQYQTLNTPQHVTTPPSSPVKMEPMEASDEGGVMRVRVQFPSEYLSLNTPQHVSSPVKMEPMDASDEGGVMRMRVQFPSNYPSLNTPQHVTTPPSSPLKHEGELILAAEVPVDFKTGSESAMDGLQVPVDYKTVSESAMDGLQVPVDYKTVSESAMDGLHTDASNISMSEFFVPSRTHTLDGDSEKMTLSSNMEGLVAGSSGVMLSSSLVGESSNMSLSEFFTTPSTTSASDPSAMLVSEHDAQYLSGSVSLTTVDSLTSQTSTIGPFSVLSSQGISIVSSAAEDLSLGTCLPSVTCVRGGFSAQSESLLSTANFSGVRLSSSTANEESLRNKHLAVSSNENALSGFFLSSNGSISSTSLSNASQMYTTQSGTSFSFSGVSNSVVKIDENSTTTGSTSDLLLPTLSLGQSLSPEKIQTQSTDGPGFSGLLKPQRTPEKKENSLSSYFGQQSVLWSPDKPAPTLSLTDSSLDLGQHDLTLRNFGVSPVKKSEREVRVSAPSTSLSSAGVVTSSSFIPKPPPLFGEGSQDSIMARLDVDNALHNVMVESSVDYSASFQKLAEQLADNSESQQM